MNIISKLGIKPIACYSDNGKNCGFNLIEQLEKDKQSFINSYLIPAIKTKNENYWIEYKEEKEAIEAFTGKSIEELLG